MVNKTYFRTKSEIRFFNLSKHPLETNDESPRPILNKPLQQVALTDSATRSGSDPTENQNLYRALSPPGYD